MRGQREKTMDDSICKKIVAIFNLSEKNTLRQLVTNQSTTTVAPITWLLTFFITN